MIEVGDTLTFSSKLYDKDPYPGGIADPTAVLVNPVSATLTITDPNDAVTTPTITVPPAVTGTFSQKVNATLEGRYRGRWIFTLADASTSAYTEIFDVQPSDSRFLISLRDAKIHLNIPLTRNNNDEELRDFLTSITPLVEDQVGATVPKTYTEVVSGARSLLLTNTPIISIVSIVPFLSVGTTYTSGQVRFTEYGEVLLNFGDYFYGSQFTVIYTAGRKPLPPNITQATKIILKHMWETQRGASGSPRRGEGDSAVASGAGYTMPNRALQLLHKNTLGPSVG